MRLRLAWLFISVLFVTGCAAADANLFGKELYDRSCAACHGTDLRGTDRGPSHLSVVYEPSHHGDAAFLLAARNGVRQHHWPFGNMPKQPQVTKDQVAKIIEYVRELQVANGIVYRQHNM